MKFYMCACWRRRRRGRVAGDGGGSVGAAAGGETGCWSHPGMVIKAGAVVTKLSPCAWLLSAASILRERQAHYREERGEREEERLGEEWMGGKRGLWLKD